MTAALRNSPSSLQRTVNRIHPRDNLVRTATAIVVSKVVPGGPEGVLRRMYGDDDQVSPLLLRAATSAARLGDESWAGSVASQSVSDFIAGLAPSSAASALIRQSLQLRFDDGYSSISVPGIIPAAGGASFTAEGAPIPVRGFSVAGPVLVPRRLASISVITRELAQRSNAEAIVRQAMTESAALSLDTAMLSDAPADDARPAGLRAGVAGLTPVAGGGFAAMSADLTALASAVAPVGGSQIVFIANVREYVKISLQIAADFPFPILPSSGLPAGTVMAVALPALVTAVDPTPEIDASNTAALHMSDTPAHLSTAGTPNTAAAPIQSMLQTAQIALRLQLGVSWGLRAPGAIAWIGSVTW